MRPVLFHRTDTARREFQELGLIHSFAASRLERVSAEARSLLNLPSDQYTSAEGSRTVQVSAEV